MRYYKMKGEHDNKKRSDGSILVANELYTENEMKKYNIPMEYCDPVEVSKKQVYFFFGARFS